MIAFQNVTFTYPNALKPAIANITLQIPEGEFVLVVGESGAGKSTFLRCLNGLVPHFSGGTISGRIRVGCLDPVQTSPKRMSREVGFVFQDPESQFVMDTVEDDIAFTLENAGIPPKEILERLETVIASLNIGALRGRKIQTLSGGERQKVAIASAIVLSPRILVLDEPTSQLDPYAAKDILETIVQLKHQLSLTVLISEHRLERLLHYANRLIYFDSASGIVQNGLPDQVLPLMSFHPPVVSLGLRLGWKPLPLSVEQAKSYSLNDLQVDSSSSLAERKIPQTALEHPTDSPDRPALQLHGVSVKIGHQQVLENVNLELFRGEILALMGPNGAGKTTLLRAITGLQKPAAGELSLHGKDISSFQTADLCLQIGYIPQDPNLLLFADKVIDELVITLRNHRLPIDEAWLNTLLSQLGILTVADCYPRDLSVGQRQRVALGAILVTKPDIILLDEPTRGMDLLAKKALITLLAGWRSQDKSILLVTHDVELVANCADRIALLEKGHLTRIGLPRNILPEFGDFAPQIAQIFPGKGWLTESEIIHTPSNLF
jgi:energy-coupling factor transport system ATP-binding protein